MRKIFIVIWLLLILPFSVMACGNQGVDLESIDIEAIDRFDVPEGTYTIQYSIEDITNLVKNYGAVVSFSVTNSEQEVILVSGNSFTVEPNKVYTVVIRLTVGEEYKEKTITVTAITASNTVSVTFEPNGGAESFPALSVSKNTVLTLTQVPTKNGFSFVGWYMDVDLTIPYTNQAITENTTLYAKWNEIIVSSAVVSFDLQGGQGTFANQNISIGSYATRPSAEPTKDSYLFLGWYVEASGNQPFDFETMTIYHNTTVYAKWEEVSSSAFTVTYDLNGAFQPEPITERVNSSNHPNGPSMQFIYSNHIFMGWSTDAISEDAIDLDTLTITEDITLYAVWHVDFDEIDALEYTQSHQLVMSSTINEEGFVEQRITVQAFVNIKNLETDNSIDENRIDYGVLYTKSSDKPTYYSKNAVRIANQYDSYSGTLSFLNLNILSEPLESDTEYTFVFFSRYETKILYSEAYSYQSFILVPEGTVVGANYVLSGGYYRIDTGNVNFRPSMYIEILDGYSATIDGSHYASYSDLYREGIRELVTKNLETGKEYLHVFNLDLQTPHVSLIYTSLVENGISIKPQYRMTFPFDDVLNYPISEIGVLYSTHHPFLKLGMPDVAKKSGELDNDDLYMTTKTTISVANDTIYIRAYAIINGKVSYARYITKLVRDSGEDTYSVVETIDTFEDKLSPEFGTSFSIANSTVRVYKVVDDALTYTDYSSSFELKDEGQYFIRNANGTGMIQDYLIIDDFPEVIGVSDFEQYSGSVLIEYNCYNPYWYYSLDGGDYVSLPAKTRLSVPGYYEVYYRTGDGMQVIHFEIVD